MSFSKSATYTTTPEARPAPDIYLQGSGPSSTCRTTPSQRSRTTPSSHDVTELSLSRNNLTQLRAQSFSGLRSLRLLRLDHNWLRALPAAAFAPLAELRLLDLRDNRLQALQAGAFAGCARLAQLLLSDNHLQRLEDGAFRGLPALQLLNADRNSLQQLQARALRGAPALQELSLRDNNISNVEDCAFAANAALQEVHLQDNPIQKFTCLAFFEALDSMPVLGRGRNKSTSNNIRRNVVVWLNYDNNCLCKVSTQTQPGKEMHNFQQHQLLPHCYTRSNTEEGLPFTINVTVNASLATPFSQRPALNKLSTTQTVATAHITTTQATEESKITGNPNHEETTTNSFSTGGKVPEGNTLGITYSQIVFSLGGGVVLGVVFGGVLWAGIHVSRKCGKRRAGAGGVPDPSRECHVYEEIDGDASSVFVERVPLNPIAAFASSNSAGGAR